MKKKTTSRREFIKKTSITAAVFSIVPRYVLGGNGYIPPSDQLTKAVIGTGSMGVNHFSYEGTRVVAICDVDKVHLQKAAQMVGGGVKTFHDYRELLQLPEVDVVHIATPPHWHGIISVDAARAGKDIWCEKPMTHTIGEGKRVIEAVEQYGR
ncbi:MAG TPA: Gfo/Idh/MocA family oxidoreductase, partial [Ginsengibacter sp.]|nr:Gfo/Idh/MocA family oxidoreductase [Ginsengibacter sp.]